MLEFVLNHKVSIVGALIGLLYLYLEYKASIFMWIASIVMAVFYIYIFYSTQLYASIAIYSYFVLASIYGWIMWVKAKQKSDEQELIIRHVSPRCFIPILVTTAVLCLFLYVILNYFSYDSLYVKLGDALATSLNIVALWMASRRWVEQWCLLIPANAISSILLYHQDDIVSSCLFIVFFVVSIAGYFNWRKLALGFSREG